MPYPRYLLARSHKFSTRTTGSFSITSTTFAALDVATDIALAVTNGDTLEIGLQAQWGPEAVNGQLRAVTVVGATIPTPGTLGDGTLGNPAWQGSSGVTQGVGGSYVYVVKAADISSNVVTVRLEARVDAAVSKTLFSTAAIPLHFWVKNLGPLDPN